MQERERDRKIKEKVRGIVEKSSRKGGSQGIAGRMNAGERVNE